MPIAPSPAQSFWGGDPIVRRGRPCGHGRRSGGHERFSPLRGSSDSSGHPDCIQGGAARDPQSLARPPCLPWNAPCQTLQRPLRAGPAPLRLVPSQAEPAPGSVGMQGPGWRARSGQSPRPWAALAGLATKPRQDGPFASSWHSQSAHAARPGARGAPRPPQRWPPATPPCGHLRPAPAPGQTLRPRGRVRGRPGAEVAAPRPHPRSPSTAASSGSSSSAAPSLRTAIATLPGASGRGDPGAGARAPGSGGRRGAAGRGAHTHTSRRRRRAASRMSHPARAERGPGLRQRWARPT